MTIIKKVADVVKGDRIAFIYSGVERLLDVEKVGYDKDYVQGVTVDPATRTQTGVYKTFNVSKMSNATAER